MTLSFSQAHVLDRDLDAPRQAREYARTACARMTSRFRDEAVALVVTETVANALSHGQGEIQLFLRISRVDIFVAVQDQGPGFLTPSGNVDLDNGSGRGLRIVSEIASSWGAQRLGDEGTLVWCVVPAHVRRATAVRVGPCVSLLHGTAHSMGGATPRLCESLRIRTIRDCPRRPRISVNCRGSVAGTS